MPNPHWLLACHESGGEIFVARLPKAIDDHKPGIPSPWFPVGPGLRPSVQKYTGNGSTGTQFILTFDYLSHLVTRIIDIATWPPTVVNPVTSNPTSIELPEDAISLRLFSTLDHASDSYWRNPVQLFPNPLFFNVSLNEYQAIIAPAVGYMPLEVPTGVTPFYRVYRRPIGTPNWTMVKDWNSTLSFTDTAPGPFQFEYTATWGMGPNPANPNSNTDYAEGQIGLGTVLHYDSTNPAEQIDYIIFPADSMNVGVHSTLEGFFADPSQQFLVEVGDDAIHLPNTHLEFSTLDTPTGNLIDQTFPGFVVEVSSDDLLHGAVLTNLQQSVLSSKAGMF